MVFPTHGYRGATLWSPCPCAIPSGDALVGRRLVLTLAPGVDFDLDLVNARIRDGTKGKITPERRCKNSKPVVQLLQNRTSTFTKLKVLQEQEHLKITLENLSKTLFNPSSHTESV